jgi:hypothetical protein
MCRTISSTRSHCLLPTCREGGQAGAGSAPGMLGGARLPSSGCAGRRATHATPARRPCRRPRRPALAPHLGGAAPRSTHAEACAARLARAQRRLQRWGGGGRRRRRERHRRRGLQPPGPGAFARRQRRLGCARPVLRLRRAPGANRHHQAFRTHQPGPHLVHLVQLHQLLRLGARLLGPGAGLRAVVARLGAAAGLDAQQRAALDLQLRNCDAASARTRRPRGLELRAARREGCGDGTGAAGGGGERGSGPGPVAANAAALHAAARAAHHGGVVVHAVHRGRLVHQVHQGRLEDLGDLLAPEHRGSTST